VKAFRDLGDCEEIDVVAVTATMDMAESGPSTELGFDGHGHLALRLASAVDANVRSGRNSRALPRVYRMQRAGPADFEPLLADTPPLSGFASGQKGA
jgi:hypothetical protein